MLVSVVVPVFNEEDAVPVFHARLCTVLSTLTDDIEVLYVNDGSTDATLSLLNTLANGDLRLGILDLSRNFGKEIAISAGLEYARGDAVIVIDADLQDPPEIIPEMLWGLNEGYDVVYAKRVVRLGESWLRRLTAKGFYKTIHLVSKVDIPEDTGDFRALSRRAVDTLNRLGEHHRYMKGLFSWIGYRQKPILYNREQRCGGRTKWNYWGLWNFALEGITSFTTAPLKISTYLGLAVATGATIYAGYIIYDKLVFGNPVAGYPSVIVIMLLLGGIQLVSLGVLGEYVGRIFNEVKRRPLYVVNGFKEAQLSRRCDTRVETALLGRDRTGFMPRP